jgi:hypothetical protein
MLGAGLSFEDFGLAGRGFNPDNKGIKINWALAPEEMRRKTLNPANEAKHRCNMQRSLIMNLELESVESLYPFVLTEDQEHLRREIREFAAREIAPNVVTWDEASEFPAAVV